MAREVWNTRVGFILAAIGSAVGLGNIWRFSYAAYENGGGVFLIPYFIALLTAGIPLMILEFGMGSKFRGAAPMAFKRAKQGFESIGWWGVITSFIITAYYSVIMGWSLVYLVKSFNLGWGSDTVSFFYDTLLQTSGSPWHFEGFAPSVLAALVVVWFLIWIIEKKGVQKGIERANKVFMPLLWILLIILVFRAVTLPGALNGIDWYLKPDFSRLTDFGVWQAAYAQAFYSLSLGMAIMITYSSYLPKKSDIVNNAFIVSLADGAFSFTMGFVVFGTLGYMAFAQGVGIVEVVDQGIGLAFMALPKALSMLPGLKVLTSAAFFLSISVAALSSLISLIEAFASALMDKFEIERVRAVNLTIAICALCSLLYATKAGIYWLDIVDHFINSYGMIIVGIFETIAIGWIFGADKIRAWVNNYSDIKVGAWWDLGIKVVLPIVLIYLVYSDTKANLAAPYGDYPISALMAGVGVIAIGMLISVLMPFVKREVE
ncbi:MAG: sodium-dependent transporter [Methanosarcinaceae archaeon]|nr:sodium-dependent transporter [Methanosarcinaceae archaeon]MDD4331505.1 sodium-dependent transporter [Methanosarcinaceae archaeon]